MRIIDVYQKDTFVVLELSLIQLEHLVKWMSRAESSYDGEKEPEMRIAGDYVVKEFYRGLLDLGEKIKPGFMANVERGT